MKSICVHCKAPLDVEDDMAGETVACPGCGENIVLEPVKNCKYCNKEIPNSATKCMHCEKSLVSIGIRKPGEFGSSSAAAPAAEEKTVRSGRKIGVLKPGERSSLPPEPVAEEQTEAVPETPAIKTAPPPVSTPSTPAPAEEPVQRPQTIALKMPFNAAAAAEEEEETASAGNTAKLSLKPLALAATPAAAPIPVAPAAAPTAGGAPKLNLPGRAPGAGGAPKLNLPGRAPGAAAAPAAGGAPKLNLPGRAPGAAAPSVGGAPKLNLPGRAPTAPAPAVTPAAAPSVKPAPVAPAAAPSVGGAPKLNLAGKAPAVAPAVTPAAAPAVAPAVKPAAPAGPKKAIAVQTSVPPPLPVAPKGSDKPEEEKKEEKPENVKPPKDWGKIIQLIVCIFAAIIILVVLAGGGYWYFTHAPFGAEDQLKKGQELFSEGKKAEACAMLERSARQGNAQAAFLLGGYYERGEGVEKNAGTAMDWYKTAAENGNADAQFMMACRYEKGEGVDKDLPKAVEFYKKASDQKHAKAGFELARCYENGIGVPKNVKAAIPLRIAAAENGDPEALYVVARYRMEGNETKYDPEQGLKDYIAAGEKGYTPGYVAAGLYYQFNDPAKAKEMFDLAFKALSAKKDKLSRPDILASAMCYGKGAGCPRDLNKAAALLTPLWSAQDAEALFLDYVLFGDSSNASEKQRASEHLKKSADLGYAPAQYAYAKRVGRSAERYLNEAVAQGNVEAYALRAEWDLKSNPKKALELATYAAERNDGDAFKILGDIYLQGLAEIKVDKKKALNYYWSGACSRKKEAPQAALRSLSKDKDFAVELFKLNEEMAKKGDLNAKTQLALYYMTGTGTTKDIKKAVELFKETKNYDELLKILNQRQEMQDILSYLSKAAEAGNTKLLYMLAKIYLEGRLVKADPKNALAWFEKAAKAGNIDAMYQVAMMKSPLNSASELYGTMPPAAATIKKEPKVAAEWFKKAAQKGHLDSQYRYGLSVLAGHDPGVKNRAAEGAKWMKMAAARNHAPALFRAVMLVLTQKKKLTSVEKNRLKNLLLRAANNNYAPAMFAYGEVLRLSGNRRGAEQWYQRAMRQKYVPAIIAMGKGKNYRAEILAASRIGYVPAIAEEGNFHLLDRVAPKQRAAKWKQAKAKYDLAYKRKYFATGNNLGCLIVLQNVNHYLRAVEYFVAARKGGCKRAAYNLAHCYFLQRNYPLAVRTMEDVLRSKPDFQIPKFLLNNLKKLAALETELKKNVAEEDQIIKRSRVRQNNRIILRYTSNKVKERHNALKRRQGEIRRERSQTINLVRSTFKWQHSVDFRDGFFHAPAALKYPWKPAGNPGLLAGK